MSYSQNDEERIIVDLFGDTIGHFLDIGAYDGRRLSNTMRLTELGWGGVCVEPSPSVFVGLMACHAGNAKIDLVNAAVTPDGGMVEFFDSNGDALSTTSTAHVAKWSKSTFRKFFVQSVSLDALLAKFGFDFDFVNIDVEGCNKELFDMLPLDRLERLRVICVEHDGHAQRMHDLASAVGFRWISCNAENLILAR